MLLVHFLQPLAEPAVPVPGSGLSTVSAVSVVWLSLEAGTLAWVKVSGDWDLGEIEQLDPVRDGLWHRVGGWRHRDRVAVRRLLGAVTASGVAVRLAAVSFLRTVRWRVAAGQAG